MARRLAAALALLVLAAGCGDNKNEDRAGVGETTTTGPTGTTLDADGRPATTAVTSGRTGTTSAGQDSGTRPTTGRPDQSTRELIDDASDGPVGNFASVLLAPGFADRLVLDVRATAGAAPSAEAINAMAAALRTHSGKAVDVTGPALLTPNGDDTYTANEVRFLASDEGAPNRDRVAVLHVLYLSGRFEREGTLGVAVRADTVALFPDEVSGAASPFASRGRIEHAVAVHELGHILGLVDLYIDRNREDTDHPGHSRNRASVMFWAVETSLVGQVLGGPPPVDFDADDVADLTKIRNGAPPT